MGNFGSMKHQQLHLLMMWPPSTTTRLEEMQHQHQSWKDNFIQTKLSTDCYSLCCSRLDSVPWLLAWRRRVASDTEETLWNAILAARAFGLIWTCGDGRGGWTGRGRGFSGCYFISFLHNGKKSDRKRWWFGLKQPLSQCNYMFHSITSPLFVFFWYLSGVAKLM